VYLQDSALVPERDIRQKMSSALKSKMFVTTSGECFGLEFQGVGPADDRDGDDLPPVFGPVIS
jgi:hypothetical protein